MTTPAYYLESVPVEIVQDGRLCGTATDCVDGGVDLFAFGTERLMVSSTKAGDF